jgi:hypothetical protein
MKQKMKMKNSLFSSFYFGQFGYHYQISTGSMESSGGMQVICGAGGGVLVSGGWTHLQCICALGGAFFLE